MRVVCEKSSTSRKPLDLSLLTIYRIFSSALPFQWGSRQRRNADSAFKPTSLMKRTFLCLLGLTLCASASLAQNVTVAGSTGANATYATLKAAFDALNANANQTGNTITVSIIGNTTETASAALNQPAG